MNQWEPDNPIPGRVRRRFSVDQYDRMIETGILGENHRVVLIRGFVVDRDSIRQPYAFTPDEFARLFQHSILTENDQVELVGGQIVAKLPEGA